MVRTTLRRMATVGVLAGVLGLGVASAAFAGPPGDVIPSHTLFSGVGDGSTGQAAVDAAVAAAVDTAAEAGYGDCVMVGDPIVAGTVGAPRPVIPAHFRAWVTLGCVAIHQ